MPRKNHILALGIVLVLCALCSGQEIRIDPANRVGNRNDEGVCWWCCVEMAGKQYGITPLESMVSQVVKNNGPGFHGGATQESIDFWLHRTGVTADFRLEGSKDQKFVVDTLCDRHLPVVTSNYWRGGGTHAILVTEITKQKLDFVDADGVRQHDYRVTYINPNYPEDVQQRTWTWWYPSWTGRAYVFDPGKQNPTLVHAPVPSGPPVLTPRVVQAPPVLAQAPPVLLPQQQLPNQQLVQHMPSHELPFDTNQPVNHGPPVAIPSNQDIRDGINRPDDVLRYGCYAYFQYDYHSEYHRKGEGRKP